MKKKILVLSLFILFVFTALMTKFLVRRASYTIQTNGKLYIVNKRSRDINVFNLSTGKEIAKIPINMESHEAIAIKDQNRIVLTSFGANQPEGNLIKVINTKTNEIEKTINLKTNISTKGIVTFNEENKVAVLDFIRNELLVLNIETDSIEKQIQTKQKTSYLLVFHPIKSLAYITNIDSNSISILDFDKNEVVKIIPCGLATESIDITPDGSEIWVTNKNDDSITVINTVTNKVIETLSTGNIPLKLKFSIDGKYCLVANANDGNIYVYNQQSKKKIKTIILHGKTTVLEKILYHTPYPVNILMHPNGQYAFIANSNANKIEVIDMKTFKIVSTISTGKIPDALVFVE